MTHMLLGQKEVGAGHMVVGICGKGCFDIAGFNPSLQQCERQTNTVIADVKISVLFACGN